MANTEVLSEHCIDRTIGSDVLDVHPEMAVLGVRSRYGDPACQERLASRWRGRRELDSSEGLDPYLPGVRGRLLHRPHAFGPLLDVPSLKAVRVTNVDETLCGGEGQSLAHALPVAVGEEFARIFRRGCADGLGCGLRPEWQVAAAADFDLASVRDPGVNKADPRLSDLMRPTHVWTVPGHCAAHPGPFEFKPAGDGARPTDRR